VNQFIYEEIANLRSYVIISAALLLATIFSVNDSVISVYGQQSTANKSVLQNNSGLKSSESGQLLTTYGPTANDLDTLKEKQSGTTVVESKENTAQIQQKQGTDEETLNLFKADDNDISTELQSSTGLQSEKPQNKEGQNREDQQEFGEDEGNEDGSNKADGGEDEGNEDGSNKADGGEDEGNEDGSNKADGGEEDASGKEKDDDIPFELPFP
jgi:hypothetical protein